MSVLNDKKILLGVSGGIDSAVTSTLCAKTGIETIVLNMPIHQAESQKNLSKMHIEWLISNFHNVVSREFDLSRTFDMLIDTDLGGEKITNLAALSESLTLAARHALLQMIDYIVDEHGLSREQAYILCSVAADLRVGQVVDVPNYIVTAVLNLDVFDKNRWWSRK